MNLIPNECYALGENGRDVVKHKSIYEYLCKNKRFTDNCYQSLNEQQSIFKIAYFLTIVPPCLLLGGTFDKRASNIVVADIR